MPSTTHTPSREPTTPLRHSLASFMAKKEARAAHEKTTAAATKPEPNMSHRADRFDADVPRHVVSFAPQVQRRRRRRRLRPEPRCRRCRRKARKTLVVAAGTFDLDTERVFGATSTATSLIHLFFCGIWGWYSRDRSSARGKLPSFLPLLSPPLPEAYGSCPTARRALLLGTSVDLGDTVARHRVVALASSRSTSPVVVRLVRG